MTSDTKKMLLKLMKYWEDRDVLVSVEISTDLDGIVYEVVFRSYDGDAKTVYSRKNLIFALKKASRLTEKTVGVAFKSLDDDKHYRWVNWAIKGWTKECYD